MYFGKKNAKWAKHNLVLQTRSEYLSLLVYAWFMTSIQRQIQNVYHLNNKGNTCTRGKVCVCEIQDFCDEFCAYRDYSWDKNSYCEAMAIVFLITGGNRVIQLFGPACRNEFRSWRREHLQVSLYPNHLKGSNLFVIQFNA